AGSAFCDAHIPWRRATPNKRAGAANGYSKGGGHGGPHPLDGFDIQPEPAYDTLTKVRRIPGCPGRGDRCPMAGPDCGRRGRAGLKVLVPGYPQWSWRQRGRASVLLGSYAAALGVGLFCWGTPTGFVVLAFAYGTHVVSVTDVIRQQAFPGFGRWVPALSS